MEKKEDGMNQHAQSRKIWALVLAGGEGKRMEPWIRGWLGEARPKQYCAFTGERTMLEHTMERAVAAAGSTRVVTVIGKGHWRWLDEPRRLFVPGRIVEQPENRGTGVGLLLGLAHILAEDPEADILVLPSDHFVHSSSRFLDYAAAAVDLANLREESLVMMAARPDRAETEYGWIEPRGRIVSGRYPGARGVARMLEKPGRARARAMYEEGCLWNTMVLAFRGRAFWKLFEELHPWVVGRFDPLLGVRGGRVDGEALAALYRTLPEVDLSRDVLQRVPARSLVLPMEGVLWCDWGRPERLKATVEELGLSANYPREAEMTV
ncbi:MAG: hypothetical protein CO113_02125 [Elusimicrobia bacterium CG_4_9_14_3_um_filter_62_55]|nr:MAG: hypothetical protein COR54_06805 [Elusimicrobia bacterium CG22_combo_CG10-13_8_21_14_all_63_91]PJA14876.1 MAG: hypothetical protein COX66_11425 [Elusimicrobia bacterium CG_4_10_14_0_2_um_filter_63_34]PJB26717.1 MAG: hypothetical protein CO113_02125 [Elusimicrobia bacterium CG_4_9_14_3_um_filter_62_55]